MIHELETQERSDVQELNLDDLDAVVGGLATPDVSGIGKPVWAGLIAPGNGEIFGPWMR
jgi:hypothetical protein